MTDYAKYGKFFDKTNPKIKAGQLDLVPEPITAVKLDGKSVVPTKEPNTNIGHDLQVIARADDREEDIFQSVNDFSTGLKLRAPKGYHIEIVGHPSLVRFGYFMIGPKILNPEDEDEEVIISLYKFTSTEDIQLPHTVGIVILRETEHTTVHPAAQRRHVEKVVYEEEEVSSGASTVRKASKVSRSKPPAVSGKNSHFM